MGPAPWPRSPPLVQAERPFWPDWRDLTAYAPLLDADRSLIAWEWLRRDPDYRAAAEEAHEAASRPGEAIGDPERFGLVTFEPPDRTVPNARPLWRSDVHPFVLPVDARRGAASGADEIDLRQFQQLARIIVDDGAEHLLLSDGLRSIRLDGPPGAFAPGPICLHYSIEGVAAVERPLLTLRRFLALCRSGRFARSLHPRDVRGRRWIMMLRAHDALAAGADQRQIAEQLFSASVAEPRWRTRESSVRSQVQRLVRSARSVAREYRQLLR